jgi:hypothetical protein
VEQINSLYYPPFSFFFFFLLRFSSSFLAFFYQTSHPFQKKNFFLHPLLEYLLCLQINLVLFCFNQFIMFLKPQPTIFQLIVVPYFWARKTHQDVTEIKNHPFCVFPFQNNIISLMFKIFIQSSSKTIDMTITETRSKYKIIEMASLLGCVYYN